MTQVKVKLCDSLFCAEAGQAEDTSVNEWPAHFSCFDALWLRLLRANGDSLSCGRQRVEFQEKERETKTVQAGIHPFLTQR